MPRWARFLSCTFTGILFALGGFLVLAYWWEGGATYWVQLFAFFSTVEFWSLVWLFGLLVAATLVLARIVVNLYDLAEGFAGLVAGAVVGATYVAFLVSSYSADWGGVALSFQKAWPAGALFAGPLAFAGAFTTWLWDRLEW